jgi:hypothetical protein
MHSYGYNPLGDEPTQQLEPVWPPRQPWWRNGTVLAIGVPFLAAILVVVIGFIVLKPSGSSNNANAGNTVPFGTSTATATPTPSPTASPTPSPTPTATTSKPAPVQTSHAVPTAPPTQAPPPAELPPAPAPPVQTTTPGCQPTKDGTDASFSDVRATLAAAGAKHYWQGVVKPQGPPAYTGDGTDIAVPTKLMNAVAYQESGWQSAIIACDGGVGLMQIMPGTIDQLNLRFGTNYSAPLSMQENAEVGANYLEWLIMYFGLFYFGQNYDVFVKAPIGPNGTELELRDAVIAAYNVGPSALENSDNTLSIPNWNYVNAVEHFMDSCPCDAL